MRTFCIITAFACVCAVQHAASQGTGEIWGYDPRIGGFDLTELRIVYATSITDEAKVDTIIGWMRKEISSPSPTRTGLGGGPIDSDYIQEQMIIAIRLVPAPVIISRRLEAETDPAMRQRLIVALGLCYGWLDSMSSQPNPNPKYVPVSHELKDGIAARLREVLRTAEKPFLRAEAAQALGDIGAVLAIPDILEALDDKYNRPIIGGDVGPPPAPGAVFYPVRDSAVSAFRKMGVAKNDGDKFIAIDRKRVAELISAKLTNEKPEIVLEAVRSLGKLGDEHARAALSTFVASARLGPSKTNAVPEAEKLLANHP